MKINIIDKFLLKLFFLALILLAAVVLNDRQLINLNQVKAVISQNINFTNIVKVVNGNLNIIDLGDNTIKVNKNDYIIEENNGLYIYKQKTSKVINQTLGSVVKIERNKDLYNVIILDENDNYLKYMDLLDINVKLYQIVKINEVIGECNNLNSVDNYYYYFKLKINED